MLGFFWSLTLSQAHPGPAAILIDEFDAGSFQSAANRQVVGCRHRSFGLSKLRSANGGDPHGGFAGEILGTPSKEGPGSPNLAACQRLQLHVDSRLRYCMISSISSTIRMIIESPAYQTPCLAIQEVMKSTMWTNAEQTRRTFIGGSDARIIMASHQAALIQLWREKRRELLPADLPRNHSVQIRAA